MSATQIREQDDVYTCVHYDILKCDIDFVSGDRLEAVLGKEIVERFAEELLHIRILIERKLLELTRDGGIEVTGNRPFTDSGWRLPLLRLRHGWHGGGRLGRCRDRLD